MTSLCASFVLIAGASAGGNLAAAVALKLRDEQFPIRPHIQVLIVPCLQAFDFRLPSYVSNVNNAFLPSDWMVHFWMLYGFGLESNQTIVSLALNNDHTSVEAKRSSVAQLVSLSNLANVNIPQSYVPDDGGHGDSSVWSQIKTTLLNPYFAPLMADDLRNLPKTYVLTADYDVLRDDGLMFARRLSDAGNDVTLRNYKHTFHAVIDYFNSIETSRRALAELVTFLTQNL